MNEQEAVELFSKRSVGGHDDYEVADLVKKLDYIPLAISQAASHIAERAGRMTIAEYLVELDSLDQKSLKVLEASIDESHRDDGRSNSVVATWMVSFWCIQTTMPSAARLLSLMCLFDRHTIPEELLTGQYPLETVSILKRRSWWRRYSGFGQKTKPQKPLNEKPTDDSNFSRDHLTLHNFALIKAEKDGQHFEMHRLIQLATKRWLELQNNLSYWTSRYITLMHTAYPWPEESNEAWSKCQSLFPHAQRARQYRPTDSVLLQNWGFLLQSAAAYAHELGSFADAEIFNRDAVSAWESMFGKNHPNTLGLVSNLGYMLLSLNRLQEAEGIHRRVLVLREQMSGKDDEETLKAVYAVGNVLLSKGKFNEAERMYRRVLVVREKRLRNMHRDTRLVVVKLMGTLRTMGREEEVDELLLRAFPSEKNDVR
jgi:hypothetical protein